MCIALSNLESSIEMINIILNETIKNEKGEESCTVKFENVESLATYLKILNDTLLKAIEYYKKKPCEDFRKEFEIFRSRNK